MLRIHFERIIVLSSISSERGQIDRYRLSFPTIPYSAPQLDLFFKALSGFRVDHFMIVRGGPEIESCGTSASTWNRLGRAAE